MTNIRALLSHNIRKHRQLLGMTQEKLADKVSTSAHYIAQIEQKNKFPSPDMIERIAAALEIDCPALFSIDPFSDEALNHFQESVLSDIEKAVTQAVKARLSELKKVKPSKKRVSKKGKI